MTTTASSSVSGGASAASTSSSSNPLSWQDLLAVDSQLCALRMASDGGHGQRAGAMAEVDIEEKHHLRPIYLKRRWQLLQSSAVAAAAGQPSLPSAAASMEVDSPKSGGGPVRNRRYISLRVKLLKRQFGLPADVLSLKNLSLSASEPEGGAGGPAAAATDSSSGQRFSYSGVQHIFDQHTQPVTRLLFANHDHDTLVASSLDGRLSVCAGVSSSGGDAPSPHLLPAPAGVLDFDLSESNQFLVSCSGDGSLVLWDLPSRRPLRTISAERLYFSRFLPRNNNLIVCGASTGFVRLLNVSTGKFAAASPPSLLGRSTAVEISQSGALLWVGNDRGYVESFRLEAGRVHKGCRVNVASVGQNNNNEDADKPAPAVTSLSSRASLAPISRHACLLVGLRRSARLQLHRVLDDVGRLELLLHVDAGGAGAPRCALFAPLLSYRRGEGTCVVAGGQDGSLAFYDAERRQQQQCVNKLLGHALPVIAVGFSHDERFLASADESGQIIVWKK